MNKRQAKKAHRYKAIRILEDILEHDGRLVANIDSKGLLVMDCKDMNFPIIERSPDEWMSVNIEARCKNYCYIPIKTMNQRWK